MKRIILLLISSQFVFACATAEKSIVKKNLNNHQALIEVKGVLLSVGDILSVTKKQCHDVSRRDLMMTKCIQTSVGNAKVIQMNSVSEAIIQSQNSLELEQGMMVDKIAK